MWSIGLNTRVVAIMLAALLLFHAANNVIWLRRDARPPAWDQSWHLILSLSIYRTMSGTDNGAGRAYPMLEHARENYPPMFHILASPFYALLGEGQDAAVLENILFLAVTVLSVYLMGERIRDSRTGLLAAFIVSMYPMVVGLSRQYLIDLALTSFVALSVYVLLLTEKFSRPRESAILGLTIGLGMLVKWTFALFLLGPVLISIRPGNVRNAVLSALVCLVVMSPWYVGHFESAYSTIRQLSQIPTDAGTSAFYYFYAFSEMVSPPLAIVFILSLYPMSRRRDRSVMLSWLLVPIIAFSMITAKDLRYLLPLTPLFAVVSSVGISGINNKIARRLVLFAVVAFSLTQYLYLSYGLGFLPPLSSRPGGNFMSPPSADDWQTTKMLDAVNRTRTREMVSVQVISELENFNDINLQYVSYLGKYPVSKMTGPTSSLSSYDYVITKTGFLGKTWRSSQFEMARQTLGDNLDRFQLVGRFPLPDGTEALVYRRV